MRVISLHRTPERLARFRVANPHIPATLLRAVDGREIDRAELASRGFLPAHLPYTPGAVGCLLSHLAFWDEVVQTGCPMTVFEDDAVVHGRFEELSAGVLASLPDDWHFCLWGWNFDAALMFDLLPGISPCVATFNQEQLRGALGAFRDAAVDPRAFPLIRAYGTVSYAISPAGVEALRPLCVPVPSVAVQFHDRTMPNNGIDITLNAAYRRVRAYVCFPPLVVTANEHVGSTVLEAGT